MKRRLDAFVKCPYYKGEEKQMIFCEGVQEGSALHLAFNTSTNLKDYKNRFCKECYNQCLVAGMLNRKYDYQ